MRSAASYMASNDMIINCGFIDFWALGNTMSWQGRRGKQMIRCRIDRALPNEECHTLFPWSFTKYLGLVGSDRRPIIATVEDKVIKKWRKF